MQNIFVKEKKKKRTFKNSNTRKLHFFKKNNKKQNKKPHLRIEKKNLVDHSGHNIAIRPNLTKMFTQHKFEPS